MSTTKLLRRKGLEPAFALEFPNTPIIPRTCPVNTNGFHGPLEYEGYRYPRTLYRCAKCGAIVEVGL